MWLALCPSVTVRFPIDRNGLWLVSCALCLNLGKRKKIVRPHPNEICLSSHILSVERIQSAKLLGISLADKLQKTEHIDQTASLCNQKLYLLCLC